MEKNIELSKANHRAAVRNTITNVCKILIISIIVGVLAVIFYIAFNPIKNSGTRLALILTFETILGLIEIVGVTIYLKDIIIFNKAVDYKDKVLSDHAVVNKSFRNEYLTRKIDTSVIDEETDDKSNGKPKK
ncbi:MAG: hypothetical protein LBM72_02555 [Mycoplasmataceae bacterium]|jgi:uncharacterized membrane protein required for colicin V production|nr:hypothetical protein [Mycoplasmataceae bacterium]